jgi:hypothetical protein
MKRSSSETISRGAPCAHDSTLRALAFITVLPSVTWPSPPMTTGVQRIERPDLVVLHETQQLGQVATVA